MEVVSTLAELLPGECGTIWENQTVGPLLRRSTDLGFIKGETVQCLFSSASGDPLAYLVRATQIALRREDAARILIRKEAEK